VKIETESNPLKVELAGESVTLWSDKSGNAGVSVDGPGGCQFNTVVAQRGLKDGVPYFALYLNPADASVPDFAVISASDGLAVQVPDGKGGVVTVPLPAAARCIVDHHNPG
jgi:hypothetical protein